MSIEHVLVTGGAGFIGSHTVDALLERGYRVRILDNLCAQVHGPQQQKPSYLNPYAEFIQGDVRDPDVVARALDGVDAVIHDAAMVGVGQSQYQIHDYVDVNVNGTAVLLEAISRRADQIQKLLVASSMSIYGEGTRRCPHHGVIYPAHRSDKQLSARRWDIACPHCGTATTPVSTREFRKLSCTSVYAQSKKDQEEYSLIVGRTYNIPTVALRYFNVYGARQSLSNPYTGVAAIFSSRIKNGNAPLIYEDGLQTRDFIHVSDIVQAKMISLEDPSMHDMAVNVGTGRQTSILELAWALIQLYGAEMVPEVVARYRSGDIRDCYADISQLASRGYVPRVRVREGLEQLAEWAAQQEADDQLAAAHQELVKRGLVA